MRKNIKRAGFMAILVILAVVLILFILLREPVAAPERSINDLVQDDEEDEEEDSEETTNNEPLTTNPVPPTFGNNQIISDQEVRLGNYKIGFTNDWEATEITNGVIDNTKPNSTCLEGSINGNRNLSLCFYIEVESKDNTGLSFRISDTDKHGKARNQASDSSVIIERKSVGPDPYTGQLKFAYLADNSGSVPTKLKTNGFEVVEYINGCIKPGLCFYFEPETTVGEDNKELVDLFVETVNNLEITDAL